jgi:competence protein ComEC
MNNHHIKNKKSSYILTAIITVVIFAVMLYSANNPLIFYKLSHRINNDFDTSQDFVKFFDVGQGDSALIYSNGYSALIDVGEYFTANDLAKSLYDSNVFTLNAVLISHLHSDHVSALPHITKLFKIENLIMPIISDDSIISAQNGKETAVQNGSKFYFAKQGTHFNIGEFEITILSAFEDFEENNRSLFVMAKIGGIKFLFTGDAQKSAERQLLNENLNLDCDVLKVAHHGSQTSTSKNFLRATTPDYAVISVGANNEYSHPSIQALTAIKEQNATIYRTDQCGDITFNIENGKIIVNTEK